MFSFEDEMTKIFHEAVDDEENPDLASTSLELEPEPEPESDIYDIDDDEVDRSRDWTNIPPPKKGKTLSDLKKVKLPLDSGWTVEEVMSALKPTLVAAARKYATPTFSQDEALLSAMEGVTDALRTDKGISPFTTHAFPAIKSRTMRAAAGTRDFPTANVSGVKPHQGGTDFLKSSRATVSADAPVSDEGEGTFATRISGDPTTGQEAAKEQIKIAKLLANLFGSEEIGLTDTERIVMQATYGIDRDGGYTSKGAQSTSAIADAFGVSPVRISQVRKKAQSKIQQFLADKGLSSPEEAMTAYGLEEAKLVMTARMVLESMVDILNIDVELFQEHIAVPVDVSLNGVIRHAVARFNSADLSVSDVVAEGNESILGQINQDSLVEARNIAKTKTESWYFMETVSSIIGIHAQPILAVLGAKPEEDDDEE